MKKIVKNVVIVIGVLALIVGVFAGVCRFKYNESLMAGVTNIYLKVTKRGEKFNSFKREVPFFYKWGDESFYINI